MDNTGKTERLYALAEQDHIYNVWMNSYEDCITPFKSFAQDQPDEIRNFLYGYADCGRMMMQRIINIACDTMEFIEEGK